MEPKVQGYSKFAGSTVLFGTFTPETGPNSRHVIASVSEGFCPWNHALVPGSDGFAYCTEPSYPSGTTRRAMGWRIETDG